MRSHSQGEAQISTFWTPIASNISTTTSSTPTAPEAFENLRKAIGVVFGFQVLMGRFAVMPGRA